MSITLSIPLAPPTEPAAPPSSATRAGLRLLHAASPSRSGGWLAAAIDTEGAGLAEVEEVVGVTAALTRLRESSYEAVLVSHEPGVLAAVDLIEGLRVAGHEEAVVVLIDSPSPETEMHCHEAGADAVCPVGHATPRSLLALVERSIQTRRLVRENQQLVEAERQRLAAEHRDAEQVLTDQRRLVQQLESLALSATDPGVPTTALEEPSPAAADPPAEFAGQHGDLLRAYVIMGAGNLAPERDELAERMVAAGVPAERAIQTHLVAVERLLDGLGRRSARHVMNRADLLILELVAKLADGYRRRYHERVEPPRQLTLPGFGAPSPRPPVDRNAA